MNNNKNNVYGRPSETPLFLEPYIQQSLARPPSQRGAEQHTHILPPMSDAPSYQQPAYRLPPAASVMQQDYYQPPASSDRDSIDLSSHYNGSQSAHHTPSSREESPEAAEAGGDPNDPKRQRSCESCRRLKVKCIRDESQPGKPCVRCAKARRECIITAPSRKRQKKADTRVEELDQRVKYLESELRKAEGLRGIGPISPPQSANDVPTPPHRQYWKRGLEDRSVRPPRDTSTNRTKRRLMDTDPDIETHMSRPRPTSPKTDESESEEFDDNGNQKFPFDDIVDQETATRVFDRYVAEMAQHLPAVVFESHTTAAEVRASRPILFLAILDTASVGMLDLEVQQRLNDLILDVYANSILRQGEKSLDLIQALMVSTIWYRPPKKYEQMNVYMLTHIAALMALDFGMGRKLNASRNARVAANVGQSTAPKTLLRSDSVEARRTWLGCYFVCMNVSISYRRPPFIKSNRYITECIKVLESAPETLPSDKRLCQQVRLMQFNENIGTKFSMDDPSAVIHISDPRVQFTIDSFVKELDELQEGVPPHLRDLSLEFSQHFSRLYAHEIALHHNHNVDDFRAPFTEESLRAPALKAKSLSPYHEGQLMKCVESIHAMFATFSRFDLQTVKALPIFYFVRIAYAVVMLIKLNYAISDPESDQSFGAEELHVEKHLDELLQIFQRVAADDGFRPARMFMVIVSNLRTGFKAGKGSAGGRGDSSGDRNAVEAASARERKIPIKEAAAPSAWRTSKQSASSTADSGVSRKISQPSQCHGQAASQGQIQPQTQLQSIPNQPEDNMQYQQQLYQQAAQQQQQQMNYGQVQNPLQFLSEVATNNAQQQQAQGMIDFGGQEQEQMHSQDQVWFQQPVQPLSMDFADHTFQHALDMTMSIGEGDLTSLFAGEDVGYGAGMIPQGHMSAFGHMYPTQSDAGTSGGWAYGP